MTIDEYISRIDRVLEQLPIVMPDIADEAALNSIALIKKRIIDERQGIAGAHYSTHPMLATKNEFVVKGAFKQSLIEETRFHRDAEGKKKKKRGNEKKVVKRGLWIKFPNASKAVPVMILEGGYKEFREIQGRPGDHVNLSFTGAMWQAVTIVARAHNGNIWYSIIGGLYQEAQDKLKWNTEHFGPFLELLPDEIETIQEVVNKRIETFLNSILK